MSTSNTDPNPPTSEDFIQRGIKQPSHLGTALFVGLRGADPLLQYGILGYGLGAWTLQKIGLEILPAGLPINTGIKLIDGLGLSPYRLVLLGMATGSAIKHIFWVLYINNEKFLPRVAILIGAFNCACNSAASLAFTTALFSASLSNGGRFPQPPLVVGSLLYVVGLITETYAEIQRKQFKDDPKNAGKCYTGGLWQYVRHVNYTGYTMWRMGYFIAAGGWTLGAAAGAFLLNSFVSSAIPELDEYCTKRYKEQWADYKRKTPYKIVPGVY